MIDERCLSQDVDRSKISQDAEISGSSFISGPRTAVGAGAVVRNSRLHDVVVGAGAAVIDSIIVSQGPPKSHDCDAAGRTVVTGAADPCVGGGAVVRGSTLCNTSVGPAASVVDTWAGDCRFGGENRISQAKIVLVNTADRVTIAGPTEVSEAYLGHDTTIDSRGYFEGIFSNSFHRVRFDPTAAALKVIETIDLPHVSRYGVNTVNSTNSGKLLPQSGGVIEGFGPHLGLWEDPLLSHEQIELGPCCWIAPRTKLIGQSAAPHAAADALVNDELTTYVMPFAVAGLGADQARGLVMPGELSTGLGPKQRKGAWAFTYAPGAVIRMVERLADALEPQRKHLADTIVVEALRTAMEMTRAMAFRRGVDLSSPAGAERHGWPRWITRTHAMLRAHLDGRLWEFADGQPKLWEKQGGKWTHPRFGCVLEVAPDALENQMSEEQILAFEDPAAPSLVAVPTGGVAGTDGEPEIDPAAKIAPGAVIGRGCRIGPGAIVEQGARVWNTVVDNCTVGPGATVERSVISGGRIGAGALVRSSRMTDAHLGAGCDAQAATVVNARLAANTDLSAFADVRDVRCDLAGIIGGRFESSEVDVHLMTMHICGECRYLKAVPVCVELGGRRVAVPGIPMLGGGALIRGAKDAPVEMQCCFIGANAILEQNTYVGFGCFVLGQAGPNAGLPPFTVCADNDARRHQIGAVLISHPSTIITHFINWTYQAVGPKSAPAVAQMTVQAIREGIAAVRWEISRRAGERTGNECQAAGGSGAEFAKYRSLPAYSDEQLRAGLARYTRALQSGAWDIRVENGELKFASVRGCWVERAGSAFWKAE